MSAHSFDPAIAEKVGVPAAVIYKNFEFWTQKNAANNRHFHDGLFWTYNSLDALTSLFPYLTIDQIRGCIKKLIAAKLIKKGNYNKVGYDRTTWYAVESQMHLVKIPNGSGENPAPIPYGKPDIPPNPQRGDALAAGFDEFWNEVPNAKRGSKTRAFDRWEKLENDDRSKAFDGLAHYYAGRDTVQAAQYLRARKFDGLRVHVPPTDPLARLVYDAIDDPTGFDTWFGKAEFRDGVVIQSSPTALTRTVKKYGDSLSAIGFEIVAEAA